MFLDIQDGSYTINVNAISHIEWEEDGTAEVHMIGGCQFSLEGEDVAKLVALINGGKRA